MKKKLVEKTKPNKTKKNGTVVTTQVIDGILILNLFKNKKLYRRYCMNVETGEYADLDTNGLWGSRKISYIVSGETYWFSTRIYKDIKFNTEEDKKRIPEALHNHPERDVWNMIESMEESYNRLINSRAYDSKKRRIEEEMNAIPPMPDIDEWVYEKIGQNHDYTFLNKETGEYCCTNCGKEYQAEDKWKNNQKVICPGCGKEVVVKKTAKSIKVPSQVMVIQNMDEFRTAIKFIDVRLEWNAGEKRYLNTSVAMIVVAYKQSEKLKRKISYRIYYNQAAKLDEFGDERYRGYYGWWRRAGYWDGNPASRKTTECYLYPDGIEALDGTIYERWTRTFKQMAAGQWPFWYNNLLMSCYVQQNLVPMVEYLYKGRFYRLLNDVSEIIWPHMDYRQYSYDGDLNPEGTTIEEVFGISDRQVINRIRDINGSMTAYRWLRLSHEEGWKLPQATLEWLEKEGLEVRHMSFILGKMSLSQIMNYVKRQQAESYLGKTAKEVLSQWEDYLKICEILKKKTDDEMIYKPRELKRRHDEAVIEREAREAEIIAEEYSEKYGEAEAVLREIKEKFEYSAENYFVKVPELIVDIVTEGRYLHHCAGATDRYFERIKNHETYICFLRKAAEPDVPYYTIEVEPGGTIRQHRGMFDEEPEFDQVKPFLQEWQRVIKQRMKKEDFELARISKEKREANTADLIMKNNLKVLKGLEEDFMDAEAV